MSKKLTFLVILIVLTAFTSSYLFMGGRGNSDESKTGTILDKFNDSDQEEPPSPKEGQLITVSNRRVVSPASSAEKGIIFYEKNTGKVFEVDLDVLSEKVVSGKVLENFFQAIWAPSKKAVIGLFYSPKGTSFRYYDYLTKKTADFGTDVKSMAVSPDSSMVAYFTPGRISISYPDGKHPKKILDTRLENLELYWPLPDRIALKAPMDLFLLTKDGGLAKLLTVSSDTLKTKWSGDGKRLLFSFVNTSSGEIELWLRDIETSAEKSLISGFSASDCYWSIDNKTIFCSELKRGSLAVDIYMINTADGAKKAVGTSTVGARDIFLSSLEDYVLFVGPADGKLYGIKIPD